ncbi:MAG: 1,4-alpha-glucan branching protein domain-containing protein [bacterium]|nr:1,4-alpha-glucan branching protein domain-containing protein [bacterium]
MSAIGYFTFVLHSHLPHVQPHRYYAGTWFYDILAETYLPLLKMLHDLKHDGVQYRIAISFSPILLEQMADLAHLEYFDQYLQEKIRFAEHDMAQFGEKSPDTHLNFLSGWYKSWYESLRESFNKQFNRDFIGAFKQLQDAGLVELLTSSATHAYLPLLKDDKSVKAQLQTAMTIHQRHFGIAPKGIWLPECGYKPGFEKLLKDLGLQFFFTEAHPITGGQPIGVASGDVLGLYGEPKRRYMTPTMPQIPLRKHIKTLRPHWVSEESAGVAVIGRDNRTGQQVWSNDWGYPGDFDYRELRKKSGTGGLRYWRVTGAKVDLTHKDFYHPEWASYKVDQHAEHFVHIVGDVLREFYNESSEMGFVASTFPTDLFGYRWFEGIQWLGKVLRHLGNNPEIGFATPSSYLEQFPPKTTVTLPESSWGYGGAHFMWNNAETTWMWRMIHQAEARMTVMANEYPNPTEIQRQTLNRMVRQLMQLETSDWLWHVTLMQEREYAIGRFYEFYEQFTKLAESLKTDVSLPMTADEAYGLAEVDYRWYAD